MNFSFLNIQPTIDAIGASAVGQAISGSTWAFAVIESAHLLALALIGGAVLMVDLRLLGLEEIGNSAGVDHRNRLARGILDIAQLEAQATRV